MGINLKGPDKTGRPFCPKSIHTVNMSLPLLTIHPGVVMLAKPKNFHPRLGGVCTYLPGGLFCLMADIRPERGWTAPRCHSQLSR